MDDYWDDKLDATATTCPDCGEPTWWEYEYCHICGWDLNQEPEGEDNED